MKSAKTKRLSIVLLAIVSLFAMSIIASALPVTIDRVKLDDVAVSPSATNFVLAKDKNEEIGIQIVLTALDDLKDVQVEAVIRGYDHSDLIEDITAAFDMKANVTYDKKLTLKLPIRMDKDRYKLRIRVEDRNGDTTQETYDLQVQAKNHEIWLRDVIFNPEAYVKAGRALLTTVRVKNIGEQDEESLKVKVAIPALGISASDFIDELKEDESTTSEELYMRIPACAEPGDYDVKVTVEFNDGEDSVSTAKQITVVEGDACPLAKPSGKEKPAEEKTIIAVGATSQEVTAGEGGTIYPVTITNQGSASKTYSLSVDVPGSWASYQVSPSNIAVVKPGETATLFVYLSAKEDAPEGENMFSITVSADGETLKQVPLKATVAKRAEKAAAGLDWATVKTVLQIGLVVLVVLLVILGLIIGFQRLKGEDEGDEESGKTYY